MPFIYWVCVPLLVSVYVVYCIYVLLYRFLYYFLGFITLVFTCFKAFKYVFAYITTLIAFNYLKYTPILQI